MSNDTDGWRSVGRIEGLRDCPWRGEPGGEAVVAVVSINRLEYSLNIDRGNSNLMEYSNSEASCDVRGQDVRSHHAFDLSNIHAPVGARQVQPHGEALTDCGLLLFSHHNRSQELSGLQLAAILKIVTDTDFDPSHVVRRKMEISKCSLFAFLP